MICPAEQEKRRVQKIERHKQFVQRAVLELVPQSNCLLHYYKSDSMDVISSHPTANYRSIKYWRSIKVPNVSQGGNGSCADTHRYAIVGDTHKHTTDTCTYVHTHTHTHAHTHTQTHTHATSLFTIQRQVSEPTVSRSGYSRKCRLSTMLLNLSTCPFQYC